MKIYRNYVHSDNMAPRKKSRKVITTKSLDKNEAARRRPQDKYYLLGVNVFLLFTPIDILS